MAREKQRYKLKAGRLTHTSPRKIDITALKKFLGSRGKKTGKITKIKKPFFA